MVFQAEPVSADEVESLKRRYLDSVTAPLDGMWYDGFIPLSKHWGIQLNGVTIGYFCVNREKALLQFYMPDPLLSQAPAFLGGLVRMGTVQSAFAGTNEPDYLGLCMELQKSTEVHTLLYGDFAPVPPRLGACPDAVFRPARLDELQKIIVFITENTGNGGDWLKGYMDTLITREESFILEVGDEMLGLGECRVSDSQLPYADLGMIVSREHRNRGLATDMLSLMKSQCMSRQLTPICSTMKDNVAAQKAIERAGFVVKNRIFRLQF